MAITVSAIFAMMSLTAGMVSFVRPVYDWETGMQVGQPEDSQRLWFAMNGGTFHFKHGIAVEGPPYRPVWGKSFAGSSFASVDFPGNPTGYRLRMVNVPFWQLFVLFAFYPVLALVRGPLRLRFRKTRGLCPQCAYDLTGNISGICPECGMPI